jgi:hypothetical protein
MVEIETDEAGQFEFIPVLATGDVYQTQSQEKTRNQTEDGDVADANGAKRQQEGETGDDLRLVEQRVPDHADGDEHHQDEVGCL